jgi:Uma2 family endonuclease
MMNALSTLNPPKNVPRSWEEEPLFEIVNGQKVDLPPMSIYASLIASRLHPEIYGHAERHVLGTVVSEALFILDAGNDIRRRPDIAFVGKDRWPLDRAVPETGDWEVVPTLAVEVVSPTDLFEKVIGKMEEYFQLGVAQVWIVIPADRQLYVYSSPTTVNILTAADTLDGGVVLPGFQLPLRPLFLREAQATRSETGAQPS